MVSTRRATDRKENLSVLLVPGEPQTKENLSVWLVPGEPQTEKKICQYG